MWFQGWSWIEYGNRQSYCDNGCAYVIVYCFSWAADVPTGDHEEVMVDLVIKAKNGFHSNLIINSPKYSNDLTIVDIFHEIMIVGFSRSLF